MEAKAIILLEWSFHLSLQHCGISHFSWVYFYLKGGSGGENRTFLKEWFLFCILSPAFYEKAFSKRCFKYFKSPGSSTSISFKIWKASPPTSLPPGSPPRVTGWTAQHLRCTCVRSCARWTAVPGSWTKDNSQHIHKSLLAPSAKDLGDLFFQRNKYISFPVSMRQGQVSFFLPLPVIFLCLRLRSSELSPGA